MIADRLELFSPVAQKVSAEMAGRERRTTVEKIKHSEG